MAIELFTLTGGLYTQRVIIYLSEKHIINSPSLTITTCTQNGLKMEAPGKPPGTIPILSLGNGKHIKQSLAILEYFEDICDEAEKSGNKTELFEHAGSSMRGKTPEERARIREIVVLADEATSHFAVAAHKASAMFTLLEPQSPTASKFALESCLKCLKLLDNEYYSETRFSSSTQAPNINIGDCVLFALLQNATLFYEKDLVEHCPNLKMFWEVFKERDSARPDHKVYPEDVKAVAKHWIQEEGVWGRIRALGVILGVLPSLIGRMAGWKK